MAAQAVSVNRNLDDAAISGLLNNEVITVSDNATLTIDSDNRWSQQAAVLGSNVIDAVTGGKILIDGRNVWQVPFSASSGNVPALGTWNVQNCTGGTSAATGEFLGIWASGELVPRAAATAMPATGYVKFRSKVGTFVVETVTLPGGATITSTGAGKRSTINVAGAFQGTMTWGRLGTVELQGDWYDLGTTNGVSEQLIDIPWLDNINAIQIETGVGTGIYEWYANAYTSRWDSATANIATDAIRGKFFNTWRTQTACTTTNASAVITTVGSTAGVYVGMPIFPQSGFADGSSLYVVSFVSNTSITVNVNANANGVANVSVIIPVPQITLARTTGVAAGYLPVAGCKIRCGNIKLSTSNSPFNGNTLVTTAGDKYETVTTTSGVIICNKVDSNWYFNLNSAYSVDMRDSSFAQVVLISNTATTTYLDGIALCYEANSATNGLQVNTCYGGGEIKNCFVPAYAASAGGSGNATMFDCADFTLTNNTLLIFGSSPTVVTRNSSDTRCLEVNRCFRITLTGNLLIMGRLFVFACVDITINGFKYVDVATGTTTLTTPLPAAIDIISASTNIAVFGFELPITNTQPYSALVVVSTGCLNISFSDVGTPAAPLNLGTVNATGFAFVASVTLSITVRRIYVSNTRLNPLAFANNVLGFVIDNVFGDFADTQAIVCKNGVLRGCSWANSTTGQAAVYGRHWEDNFTAATIGRILIACNEPTVVTASQCAVTAGTPKFTSAGDVAMPTLGDQVTWTCPYWILGHTSFGNFAPLLTGVNTGNFTMEYQIDTGNGMGSWKAMTDVNLFGETIPAYVNVINHGGFKINVRATVATASATNALTYIRIRTITTALEYVRQQPRFEKRNIHRGAPEAFVIASFGTADNQLVGQAASTVFSAGVGTAEILAPIETPYTLETRIRAPGYVPEYDTTLQNNAVTDLALNDLDLWTGVPATDPGALGITLTFHGGSPVTWNSKQWAITIKTTDDTLTASQIVNYINFNTSRFATFHGYSGMRWPRMIEPDGGSFKTSVGVLRIDFGSIANMGTRIVRNDGTTAVPGFTQMQANDGSYYVAPISATLSITGLATNSGVVVRNVTTATVVHNAIIAGTSYTLNYLNGTTFTAGNTYEILITRVVGATAKKPLRYSGTIATTGVAIAAAQVDWTEYNTAGVDGSSIAECVTDYVNIQVDVNDSDNSTLKSRLAAFIVYATYAESAGRLAWHDVIEYKSSGSAVIKSAVALLRVDNVKNAPLNVIDAFQLRMDNGSSMVSTSTYTINWDNSAEAVVVAVGSGVLPGDITSIANAVHDKEVFAGFSLNRSIRKITAMTIAKTSGNAPAGGTTTIRNLADSGDEMSATVDANGNRTAVTQGS